METKSCKSKSLEVCRHLEELAPLGAHSAAAAYALNTDAHLPYSTIDLHADILQVGLELPPADAGYLSANTAQVLGLTAARILIAQHRLLTADGTLHAHDEPASLQKVDTDGSRNC
jgi:hypothetical protein